jgi:hypothetical protein
MSISLRKPQPPSGIGLEQQFTMYYGATLLTSLQSAGSATIKALVESLTVDQKEILNRVSSPGSCYLKIALDPSPERKQQLEKYKLDLEADEVLQAKLRAAREAVLQAELQNDSPVVKVSKSRAKKGAETVDTRGTEIHSSTCTCNRCETDWTATEDDDL